MDQLILLRGINVGGHRPLKMVDLRSALEREDLGPVESYIQSGNVLIRSDADPRKLEKRIIKVIEREFSYKLPVICIPHAELNRVIEVNPFVGKADIKDDHLHISFLDGSPTKKQRGDFQPPAGDGFHLGEREIYLHCPRGYSKSKLGNEFLEKAFGMRATTRNWKTVLKLKDMLDARAEREAEAAAGTETETEAE